MICWRRVALRGNYPKSESEVRSIRSCAVFIREQNELFRGIVLNARFDAIFRGNQPHAYVVRFQFDRVIFRVDVDGLESVVSRRKFRVDQDSSGLLVERLDTE